MGRFLVLSYETDSVVAEGDDLKETVRRAVDLGYVDGYVTNQDGGRAEIADIDLEESN